MRNNVVTIVTKYPDKSLNRIEEKSIKVYAEIKSVTRSEFYTGHTSGYVPRTVVEMDTAEYHLADVEADGKLYNATHVIINNHEYGIIRAYEISPLSIEITAGDR